MVSPAVVAEPILADSAPGELAPAPDTLPVGQPAPLVAASSTPETPVLAPPISSPPLAEENASLRRQLAQVEAEKQAQATQAILTQEAQQVRRDALARGLSDEDANWMAQRHYDLAQRVHQEQQSIREQQQFFQGKVNASMIIGAQYGISPSILMGANTPAEMRSIADREKKYAAQEARLGKLEQARVQPQTLNSPGGRAAPALTLDNIDALYMGHEREHPNTPNPYETQYRRLLGM